MLLVPNEDNVKGANVFKLTYNKKNKQMIQKSKTALSLSFNTAVLSCFTTLFMIFQYLITMSPVAALWQLEGCSYSLCCNDLHDPWGWLSLWGSFQLLSIAVQIKRYSAQWLLVRQREVSLQKGHGGRRLGVLTVWGILVSDLTLHPRPLHQCCRVQNWNWITGAHSLPFSP